METRRHRKRRQRRHCCTDPTYKEWKRLRDADDWAQVSEHGSYLQGMETRALDLTSATNPSTDPTYKEWKLINASYVAYYGATHGSYLQGMETFW